MEWDYLVIGGGICGLEIGALLSTIGKVLVLEATPKVGGRARVMEKDGFKLDFGPHPVRFGKKSAIAQTMKDVGATVTFLNPGLMYAYLANGERHIFPSGGLSAIFKTKMVPFTKLLTLFASLRKMPIESMLGISLDAYCAQSHVDPVLRRFLLMASASMQVNPFPGRTSVGEMFLNFIAVLKRGSVFYPKGGWTTFFSQFQEVIQRTGGEVRTGARVTRIIIEDLPDPVHNTTNKVATGVIVDGVTIKAKGIISTVPVQHLFSFLEKKWCDPAFVTKCENFRPTAGFTIDFCLRSPISKETLVFFEDPPSFGVIPTTMDPSLAPPGKSIMSFFAPCDITTLRDATKRNAFHDRFRQQILKVYPEIMENLEYERPLFLEMVDGVEVAIDQNRHTRPHPAECGIQNFFLTGDSIGGEGAGGDIGHTSVRECFAQILHEFGSKH